MKLFKTYQYTKVEKKFFKKHNDLLQKYATTLKKLQKDPFESSLKTHKLKGKLSDFYACSLTYEYRIILLIKIVDEELVLINIGTHDDVYQ